MAAKELWIRADRSNDPAVRKDLVIEALESGITTAIVRPEDKDFASLGKLTLIYSDKGKLTDGIALVELRKPADQDAALALAGSAAAGLTLSEAELSRLARRGSGSACRSIPGGFCEWLMGEDDETSLAISLAPETDWALTDFITVISAGHKKVGSSAGHPLAATSPYQAARTATAPERLLACRNAILKRDFSALAEVSERDSTLMHAVMMTQTPPLFYWEAASLTVIKKVIEWREAGLPCFTTLDAGPNVHVICPDSAADAVESRLRTIHGLVDLIRSGPGGPARLITA